MKLPSVAAVLTGSKVKSDTAEFKYVVTAGSLASSIYTALTEQVTLDCTKDDCTETNVGSQVSTRMGEVICTDGASVCKKTVSAAMATYTITASNSPQWSKVMAYVDGKPYPRAGHNTFTFDTAPTSGTARTVKLYKLSTRVKHTLVVVLATSEGAILGMDKQEFEVTYTGGCAKDDAGVECGGKGVCHKGYCVCHDGYFGLTCSNAHNEETALTAPTTCVDTGTGLPVAKSCTGVASGIACTGGSGNEKCMVFTAATQYRARQDAILQDGVAQNRYTTQAERAERSIALAQVTAAALAKKSAIETVLETKIFGASSTLISSLATASTTTASNVAALRAKKDRNAVVIQQARLESVRLATANLEKYRDSQRSLYSQQTAMQNRLDKDYQSIKAKAATWVTTLTDNFNQARFIKNQLRTANGPRVKIADLKTETCTTDKFFKTTCTKSAATGFTTTSDTAGYTTIPR